MVGEGDGTPLQYSCLENPMDGGAWWAAVHGVAKSQTRLSDFPFSFHFHALKKEMATHSFINMHIIYKYLYIGVLMYLNVQISIFVFILIYVYLCYT